MKKAKSRVFVEQRLSTSSAWQRLRFQGYKRAPRRVTNVHIAVLDRWAVRFLPSSIDTNDLDVLAHPIQGQVDPTAVTARFDFLFNNLFAENPEFGLGGPAGICPFTASHFPVHFFLRSDHRYPPLVCGTRWFPVGPHPPRTRRCQPASR